MSWVGSSPQRAEAAITLSVLVHGLTPRVSVLNSGRFSDPLLVRLMLRHGAAPGTERLQTPSSSTGEPERLRASRTGMFNRGNSTYLGVLILIFRSRPTVQLRVVSSWYVLPQCNFLLSPLLTLIYSPIIFQ